MNRLVKMLANDDKYFKAYLVVLSIYGVFICACVAVTDFYKPAAEGYVIGLGFLGCALLAITGRIVHNICYAKVINSTDDNQNPV